MKAVRLAAVGLSALLCVPLLAACGEKTETIYQAATELSFYDGTYYEELSDPNKPYYNKELWRRNSSDLIGADPLVLDDTERTGYYYAYVTGLTYSYSDDLVNWRSGGSFMELPDALAGAQAQWAPEVIYDEDTALYYAFFSCTPQPDTEYEGVTAPSYLSVVAVSETPTGPFKPVDFTNAEEVEAVLGEGYEAYVREASPEYPQKYAKYSLLDNAEYQAAFEREGYSTNERIISTSTSGVDGGYVATIDFSPFIDPDTGESLGTEEIPICKAKVLTVKTKTTTLQIVGDDMGVEKGMIVRPEQGNEFGKE